LTPHLVRELQRFLFERGLDSWRISIGAATPEEVILIYPTVVCQDRPLAENEIDPVVTDMSKRYVEMDRVRKQAIQDRRDGIRHLLVDAYAAAKESGGLAYALHVEREEGPEGVLIRLWTIHPHDTWTLDVDQYETDPEALIHDDLYVSSDGRFQEEREREADDCVVLILWEFEENEEKTLFLQNGLQSVELRYEHLLDLAREPDDV
jgi:hypothetical protein